MKQILNPLALCFTIVGVGTIMDKTFGITNIVAYSTVFCMIGFIYGAIQFSD